MTDTTTPLGKFEGADIVSASIVITNAGDGLSEAVKVEPVTIHRGDTGYLVLEWECTEVRFAPADRDDPHGDAVRVQKLKAGTATFVDADLVAELIEEQREKNLQAREDAAGIKRLPFDDDADEDTEADADTDGMGPATAAFTALCSGLKKAQLQELAKKHGIVHPKGATALQIVKLLAEVPDIEAEARALADGNAAADTEQEPDYSADNVSELRPGGTDG